MDVASVVVLVKVWEENKNGEKQQRISFLAWNRGKKNDKIFEEAVCEYFLRDTKNGETILLLKS
jgi:hypothetical protein